MTYRSEDVRLDAFYQRNLLDTPPSETFDRITHMASQIFGLAVSAVSLTTRDRQWFEARVGVEHTYIPRDMVRGVPLTTREGSALAALCVLGTGGPGDERRATATQRAISWSCWPSLTKGHDRRER